MRPSEKPLIPLCKSKGWKCDNIDMEKSFEVVVVGGLWMGEQWSQVK